LEKLKSASAALKDTLNAFWSVKKPGNSAPYTGPSRKPVIPTEAPAGLSALSEADFPETLVFPNETSKPDRPALFGGEIASCARLRWWPFATCRRHAFAAH
jgi:hypothetical protein